MEACDYGTTTPPASYRCTTCGVHGCKLWCDYPIYDADLLCCDCAGKSQEKDVSDVDAEGLRLAEDGCRTDQIGWRVPAVPRVDGSGFWGYMSVPEDGCAWWRALPTRTPAAEYASLFVDATGGAP